MMRTRLAAVAAANGCLEHSGPMTVPDGAVAAGAWTSPGANGLSFSAPQRIIFNDFLFIDFRVINVHGGDGRTSHLHFDDASAFAERFADATRERQGTMAQDAKSQPHNKLSRRRRKEARPSEIVEVALDCFIKAGFEKTSIDEIARRAGIAKGTVYIYFETKEKLFRAVVEHVTSATLIETSVEAASFKGPIDKLIALFIRRMMKLVTSSRGPEIARLILRESDRVPDLATTWFEQVAAPLLGGMEPLLKAAQERGEIRQGDTRIQVLSILGPITAAILVGTLVKRAGQLPINLEEVAAQHAETILYGLATPTSEAPTPD